MSEQLVHRARELATLDVGDEDVVERPDDRAGQRLDPVAVDHDEVGRELADVVREALDRGRQRDVHVAGAEPVMVDERVDVGETGLLDLEDGRAVPGEHVHPGGEDPVLELVGFRHLLDQRLELPEVRPCAGQKEDLTLHPRSRSSAS